MMEEYDVPRFGGGTDRYRIEEKTTGGRFPDEPPTDPFLLSMNGTRLCMVESIYRDQFRTLEEARQYLQQHVGRHIIQELQETTDRRAFFEDLAVRWGNSQRHMVRFEAS